MKKLIDFYADWCMPCKALAPTIESLKEQYKNTDVIIEKVNIDDNPDLAQKYNVRSIPTLVFVNEDSEVFRMTGNQPKATLVKKIEELFGNEGKL